jgi:steroid delta-isomerase-like uncharacterized protein
MNTTTTENKDTIRRQFEALNRHDLDGAVACVTADAADHAALPEAQGAEGLRRIFAKLLVAFPDQQWELQDMLAEGDRVVARVTHRGTNTGPLNFLQVPLPATGRRFETEHIHIFRLAAGKVVEHWAGRDDIGMLRQLGLFGAGKAS